MDHCPEVFTLLEDGIAYVVDNGVAGNDPGGSGSVVIVKQPFEPAVIEAADDCPGECIFLELDLVE
jgi:ferredoxin